jgi:uncharacterized protein (TIGR02588 family)
MAQQAQKKQAGKAADIPAAEWAVAAVGFIVVVSVIGFVLYQAMTNESSPPDIRLSVQSVRPLQQGYVVEIRVDNRGDTTAAGLQIEGTLRDGSGNEERAEAGVDYVPSHSTVTTGLFFRGDPRAGKLDLRPLGYRQP